MEHQQSLVKRFWIYQKERFPIFGHGPLIFIFTFSAISYSRICRGAEGFIAWKHFLIGCFTSFSLFLLLRILDEFKDQEDDAKYRSHLPVPRGLVTLSELKVLGIFVFIIQFALIAYYQTTMLGLYLGVIIWLFLMTKEFFAKAFMRDRLILYAASHMLIIPFVDLYISGLDWKLEGESMHLGLILFFLVSFFNGLVLEVGRKIRIPEDESEGVQTYSSLLGATKSTYLWLALLSTTFGIAAYAIYFASLPSISYILLGVMFSLSAFVALRFLNDMQSKKAKHIEIMAGIWTLLMYATIGGLPGLIQYFL